MTWPKKDTRKINVNGMDFLWHLSGNTVDTKETVITTGRQNGKFFLFIDPYPWEFEIRPADIAKAVQWAAGKGWTAENGPNRHMAWSSKEKSFIWLPEGKKFLHEIE